MPWDIRKNGEQFCVYKKGTNEKAGCHDSRDKAVKQQRALYAKAASERSKLGSSERFHLVPLHAFAETLAVPNVENAYWIDAVLLGEFKHWLYGDITIDSYVADQFKFNFDQNIRGQELPIYYEHFGMDKSKGFKAAGWVKDVAVTDEKVRYLVEFTPTALDEIRNKEWKYFSIEWDDVWTNETGEDFTYVAGGGALTNQPFIKGMTPLNFSEIFAEVADLEHAEPGTGSPPEPRKDNDETLGGDDRRDTPPIEREPENLEETMKELLAKLQELLGGSELTEEEVLDEVKALSETHSELRKVIDRPDADLLVEVKNMAEQTEAIRKAAEDNQNRKAFADQYPEEAKRLRDLEAKDRNATAKAFSEKFAGVRLKDKDDNETTKGFSAKVLEKIESTHKAFSEGKAGIGEFEDVLEAIANNGVVDYGEGGSSRAPRIRDSGSISSAREARKAFGELVQEVKNEFDENDKKYSEGDAIGEAAKRDPELFEAYRSLPVGS